MNYSGDFKKTKIVMFANHISTKRGKSSITITYEHSKTHKRSSFNLENSQISEQELEAETFWVTHTANINNPSKKYSLSDETCYQIFTNADDEFSISTTTVQSMYQVLTKK